MPPTDPPTAPTPDPRRRPGLLLVLSGPSGVGKTTLARRLLERDPRALFSVSATTRPISPSERDGVDYHFLTDAEFTRRVEAGDFLEHAEYAGHRYGTLRAPVERALADGRLVILDIDVQGAGQVRSATPGALAVFILPPSDEELLRRLRDRRREDEAAIQRRYAQAKREIAAARAPGLYDALLVNRDLDQAGRELRALVAQRRSAPIG